MGICLPNYRLWHSSHIHEGMFPSCCRCLNLFIATAIYGTAKDRGSVRHGEQASVEHYSHKHMLSKSQIINVLKIIHIDIAVDVKTT